MQTMHLHTYVAPTFGKTMFLLGHLAIPIAWYHIHNEIGFLSWTFLKLFVYAYLYDIIGGLGITAAAHRLWAHRSYKATGFFRFILMIFNCIAFQGELFYWARDHRVHHKYSDTAADPHDITRGFFFSHMGWLLTKRTPECIKALKEVPVQDLLDDWVIRFQLNWYAYLVLITRFIIPTYMGWAITGSWKIGFFYNAWEMWAHTLHHTFLVNSAAHSPWCGYRPYDEEIYPTEVTLVSVLAIGEGHHNFHHTFPQDYATSEYGWMSTSNPTKAFIDLAAYLGFVTQRTRVIKKKSNPKGVGKKGWKTVSLKTFEGRDD